MTKPKKDLTDEQMNEWKVIKYLGNSAWECQCSCGTVKSVKTQYLHDGRSKSCGHDTTAFKDLTGMQFGEWEVLKYSGNQKWLCRCTCSIERNVESYFLTSGRSKSCGHNTNKAASKEIDRTFQDLEGKQFGDWEVLEYEGNSHWKCECSCGTVKSVHRYTLTSGTSKSCGHDTLNDLTGKRFGKITVISYAGNQQWNCLCDCNRPTVVYAHNIIRPNGTRSCGCNVITKIDKDIVISRLLEYEEANGEKPFISDVEKIIERSETIVRTYIKEYELYNYINYTYRSKEEREIASKFSDKIVSDRTVLYPYELDMHSPIKKLAIEYNGSYWHSEVYKDRGYHQRKTINCAKKGIRLIHIFEYEWVDPIKKAKLNIFLDNLSNDTRTKIYGRKTAVRLTDKAESIQFLDKYHFQNSTAASIHIGCYHDNELIGMMTFGKPRFNANYEYELIRLCIKDTVNLIGGVEKMFKYFVKNHDPQSVITYCDIAKFTGNVYTRLGFKGIGSNPITETNYVWVEPYSNSVVSRYKAQKHLLVVRGLGTDDETESEIMHRNGYLRIYDSGNLKLEWLKEN